MRYRRFQNRWWLHILLFLLTVATTTGAGIGYYASFLSAFNTQPVSLDWSLVVHATIFSAAMLGILGTHEMGHYVACRYYNVDCTLPFFIPLPILSPVGTGGAVIKIREMFPSRKALFDIGIAGPIAGFVALTGVLVVAVHYSSLVRMPPLAHGYFFGEPLLFKLIVWLKFGSVADAYQLNLHPVGFAAWFGMLATAWNLLPFGQLDGGHVAYATIGERARYVSLATIGATITLCFVSINWVGLTVVLLAMLYFLGPRHPPVLDEHEPLGRARFLLAIFAIVMFAVCFMPVPLEIK